MKQNKYLLITGVLIFWVTCFYFLIRFFMGEVYYSKAQFYLDAGNYKKSLNFVDKALENNSNEPAYYRGRARSYLGLYLEFENDPKLKLLLKNTALVDLKKSTDLNTLNLASFRNAISLYYFLAYDNSSFVSITQNFYAYLKNNYPSDVGIYVAIAKYEKRLNLLEDYTKSLEKIKKLRPDLLEWHEDLR